MEFTRDDRGVSEVIGAILVFGLMVALLAVMQTYAVPLANEEVEFNHNQDVQSDLINFKEVASRTSAHGTSESARIRMGTTYPARLLFFSPSAPSGEIRTTENEGVSVGNIQSSDQNVNQSIQADSPNRIENIETRRLEYEPNYNEWRQSPTTVMEYGALYNDFGDRYVMEDEPDVLNGNRIDLTFFDGDLARTTGGAYSLQSRPTSAPARTVPIEAADSNDNITVTIPSGLNASAWNEMLSDEPRFEWAEDNGDGTVSLHLDSNVSYQLRMSKIGVGSGVESPGPYYTTRASSQTQTLDLSGATQLPIEVRDRYNNPVSDEEVYVEVSSGNLGEGNSTANATTNDQGQPMVVYEPTQSGRVTVNASYANPPWQGGSFDPENNKEDVQFQIAVNPEVDQHEPQVEDPEIADSSCQALAEIGNITLGDNQCAMTVNYTVTDVDSNLDTVEVRMINAENHTIADSVTFDVYDDGETTIDSRDEVELSDESPPDSQEYIVRVIAIDSINMRGSNSRPHQIQ